MANREDTIQLNDYHSTLTVSKLGLHNTNTSNNRRQANITI